MVKISLVQLFCEKGDINNNLRRHNDYIIQAEEKSVDILAFPEASVTGYTDRGGYPEAIITHDGPEIHGLREMTAGKKVTVLAGFIEKNHGTKPFVTQAVIRDGQLIGCYRKMTIVDDDTEWFTPGDKTAIFTREGLKFGTAICSDLSNEEIFAEYARQGMQIVFECAAPGLHGEQASRDWRSGFKWWEGECRKYLSGYARKYGIWIAIATQAGRTVDEDFPGGGYVFAPGGECVFATKDWNPGAVYMEIDLINSQIAEI